MCFWSTELLKIRDGSTDKSIKRLVKVRSKDHSELYLPHRKPLQVQYGA